MQQRNARTLKNTVLASFLDEAGRLRAFVPPFRFTSFFSPEDTLLCMCAAEAALAHARLPRSPSRPRLRIAELTTGSGLVGLHLLRLEEGSTLQGLDVDREAIATSTRNANLLGLSQRVQFDCADLWSDETMVIARQYDPHLIICNPPYVPEPPGEKIGLEAGAGPDGTVHLLRAVEIAEELRPRAVALSWCSLSDPARIVSEAASAGYNLNSLFIVVIADGEYSGSVHGYLRSLPRAYINERPDTVGAVAPDGSGRFAYLLMAGDFSASERADPYAADAVERICETFEEEGLEALKNPTAPVPVCTWLLNRWDELELRAMLHGDVNSARERTA